MGRQSRSLACGIATLIMGSWLMGCGGGGGGSSGGMTPIATFHQISSASSFDGWIDSAPTWHDSNGVQVGDLDATNSTLRLGVVSFDLGSLPAGITITGAELTMYQASVIGDPYGKYGNVYARHIDAGPSLDDTDALSAPLSVVLNTLSSDSVAEPKTVDVTTELLNDIIAARTRTQFRLEHAFTIPVVADAIDDIARFEDADNTFGTGNVPQLTVYYTTP